MKAVPPSILRLIREFHKLPGIGFKTSERFAYHLLRGPDSDIDALANSLQMLKESIRLCEQCFTYTEEPVCAICRDSTRDRSVVCVVAEPKEMLAFEQTGSFTGLYHVLGGVIAHTEGVGPAQLRIAQLQERIAKEDITEIIFGLNPDMEGDTTALYIAGLLKNSSVRITKIARGLPMGADIEFADETTLGNALSGRQQFQ